MMRRAGFAGGRGKQRARRTAASRMRGEGVKRWKKYCCSPRGWVEVHPRRVETNGGVVGVGVDLCGQCRARDARGSQCRWQSQPWRRLGSPGAVARPGLVVNCGPEATGQLGRAIGGFQRPRQPSRRIALAFAVNSPSFGPAPYSYETVSVLALQTPFFAQSEIWRLKGLPALRDSIHTFVNIGSTCTIQSLLSALAADAMKRRLS